MKLVAAQQGGRVRGIGTDVPLLTDLVGEEGAPFSATFNLFDDAAATNSRGLWRGWSEYEPGEVVYLTPEGPESGQTSEKTPEQFGAFRCRMRSQHSEPGSPGSAPFWTAMSAWALAGKSLVLVIPDEERLNAEAVVSGNAATVSLGSIPTSVAPTSTAYRLELREAGNVLLYVARGQVIFRRPGGRTEPFVAHANETFEAVIKTWKDRADTIPRDLTGWTVELEVLGVGTLTVGKGLTVSGNEVQVTMTPAETAAAAPRSTTCTMKIKKEGKEQVVLHRQFLFLA